MTFAITTVGDSDILWTNNSESTAYSVEESVISSWISMTNASIGNLTINATYNNQTGFFTIAHRDKPGKVVLKVEWRNLFTEKSALSKRTKNRVRICFLEYCQLLTEFSYFFCIPTKDSHFCIIFTVNSEL